MTETDRIRVTACVVAHHEEAVIGRCLDSVRPVCNEIVLVHDGPCQDATLAIAAAAGARTFVRRRHGNPEAHTVFAYEKARGEWILTLDADEFLSAELAAIIPTLIDEPGYAGWRFRWPMWDGRRYVTRDGPYKLSLFRRASTTLLGHLQSSEQVHGRVGDRDEQLHHQPLYNNFTLRSARTKYRRWCRVQARELVSPFSELPQFNYSGPQRWPWWRRIVNALSPLWALPSGLLHFGLVMRSAPEGERAVYAKLGMYQGLYAIMLQLYVARYTYLDPDTRFRGLRPDARGRTW